MKIRSLLISCYILNDMTESTIAQLTTQEMIVLTTVTMFFITIVFMIFFITRYRKFRPNEYVIHIRNGKVFRVGTGGRVFLLPLLDEVFTIPTTVQHTSLEFKAQVKDHKKRFFKIDVTWRVVEPLTAFSKVSWNETADNYVELLIKKRMESILQTLSINASIGQDGAFIDNVASELQKYVKDWGLIIEDIQV